MFPLASGFATVTYGPYDENRAFEESGRRPAVRLRDVELGPLHRTYTETLSRPGEMIGHRKSGSRV